MLKYIVLILIFLLSGCVIHPDEHYRNNWKYKNYKQTVVKTDTVLDKHKLQETPPYRQEYLRILRTEYVLNKYDCSNKSAEYMTILREKGGIHADIIICMIELDDDISHALVLITYPDGSKLYVDPTNGFYRKTLAPYTYVSTIPYEYLRNGLWNLHYRKGEFDFPGMEEYED